MGSNERALQELIAHHEKCAAEFRGMANAAYGVGAMSDGDSYAETARWHVERAKKLRLECKSLPPCVITGP